MGGRGCKVRGRVRRDTLPVDVSDVPDIRIEDEVTIIGDDDVSPASAEGIACLLGASWYEVVTRLNPLIRRIYR